MSKGLAFCSWVLQAALRTNKRKCVDVVWSIAAAVVVSHSSQRKFGTLQQQLLRLTSKFLQSTTFPGGLHTSRRDGRGFQSERSPGFVGISSNACGSPCLITFRIQHTGTAVLIANSAYQRQQNRVFFSGFWDVIIQRIRQRQKETDGDEPCAPLHPLRNPWSKCFFLKQFGTFTYTIFYLWQRVQTSFYPARKHYTLK